MTVIPPPTQPITSELITPPWYDFFRQDQSDDDARTSLSDTLTYHVHPSGDDSTADGSTDNPFGTIQQAFYNVIFDIDFRGQQVIIQLADGTYNLPPSGFHFFTEWDMVGVGKALGEASDGGSGLYIQGNLSDSTAVIIDNTGGPSCFNIQGRGTYGITGLTIRNCSGNGIDVQSPDGWVALGEVGFQNIAGNAINVAYTSVVFCGSGTTLHFTGAFGNFSFVEGGSAGFDNNSTTYILHSTPSVSGVAFETFNGGVTYFSGTPTFTGSLSGTPILAGNGYIKSDTFDFTTLGNGKIITQGNGTYNRVPLTGFGYSFPAAGPTLPVSPGGTQSQGTDKTTTVILNKPTGQLTLNAANLNANTTVSFTFTNSYIANTDMLVMNQISGGTAGAYHLNAQCGTGSATINVRNITAGNLAEAIVIQFALIKGAIS